MDDIERKRKAQEQRTKENNHVLNTLKLRRSPVKGWVNRNLRLEKVLARVPRGLEDNIIMFPIRINNIVEISRL